MQMSEPRDSMLEFQPHQRLIYFFAMFVQRNIQILKILDLATTFSSRAGVREAPLLYRSIEAFGSFWLIVSMIEKILEFVKGSLTLKGANSNGRSVGTSCKSEITLFEAVCPSYSCSQFDQDPDKHKRNILHYILFASQGLQTEDNQCSEISSEKSNCFGISQEFTLYFLTIRRDVVTSLKDRSRLASPRHAPREHWLVEGVHQQCLVALSAREQRPAIAEKTYSTLPKDRSYIFPYSAGEYRGCYPILTD